MRRFKKRGPGAEKSGVRGDWDGKEVNNREQREGNASEKKRKRREGARKRGNRYDFYKLLGSFIFMSFISFFFCMLGYYCVHECELWTLLQVLMESGSD